MGGVRRAMKDAGSEYRGIRIVSWDVDGTLFSYLRLTLELLRTTFQNALITGWPRTHEQLREIWEFHRAVEKQRRHPKCRVVAEDLDRWRQPQTREKETLQTILCRIQPRRRAVVMLERLAGLGIPQVALSDFECQYKLDALGLGSRFAKAYSCEQLGFWKPSPVPLARIQSDFGVQPEEHLHIGDRWDTDGEACMRNGCRFKLIDGLPKLWRTFNLVCCYSPPTVSTAWGRSGFPSSSPNEPRITRV